MKTSVTLNLTRQMKRRHSFPKGSSWGGDSFEKAGEGSKAFIE